MTPEELYSLWHFETNRVKGRIVRRVKNFEQAKKRETWKHFELLSSFVRRNHGHVDGAIYIRALAERFGGWFDPKIFCKPRATKIYKEHVEKLRVDTDPDSIREHVMHSIKFVVRFCKAKGLSDIYEYLSDDACLIPTMLKHLSAGSISMYFLASISEIRGVVAGYPQDCIDDYASTFEEDYAVHRTRLVALGRKSKEFEKLYINVENIVNTCLQNPEADYK